MFHLIRYIKGYLKIRVSGNSLERFLNLCQHKKLDLWGLFPVRNTYEMFLSVSDFRKLKPVLRKTKTKVTILDRYGLPFFLHKYRKRSLFFVGAISSLFLIYFLSTLIWDIHIEGNFSRTDEVIMEFLETEEIRHGMRKSKADCGKIEQKLRKKFDDIIWVSASIEGSKLIIRVKENEDGWQEDPVKIKEGTDLVAMEDGQIITMITREGTPLVFPGDLVKKGEILVSGKVEIKNDAGEIIDYEYVSADADIFARTRLPYQKEYPIKYDKKQYSGRKRYEVYIRVKNTVLSLKLPGQKIGRCDRVQKDFPWRVKESFYLPGAFGIKIWKEYKVKEVSRKEKELKEMLSRDFALYCEDLEKKGVEIIGKDVKIYKGRFNVQAKGNLTLVQPFCKRKKTEMIPIENKDILKEPNK